MTPIVWTGPMKCLYVLYDSQCELCVRCRDWLMKQAALVPLVFVALRSEKMRKRFPGIDALKPSEQLLVVSDNGSAYRGAYAWIMCLWALRNYREHAHRMSHPILLPFARIVCELLSRNRFYLSDGLFRQEPQNTAQLIAVDYPRHKASWSNACAAPAT